MASAWVRCLLLLSIYDIRPAFPEKPEGPKKPFVCPPGWHGDPRNGVNGGWVCRQNDGSNNWRCPADWFKIPVMPRCVPRDPGTAAPLPPPSEPHTAGKAAAIKARMLECGLTRYTNYCEGAAYDAWLAAHVGDLEAAEARSLQAERDPRGVATRSVLWLGNSHMGQLAEAAFCALRGALDGGGVEATDMDTGCLAPAPPGPRGCGGDGPCGFYLARAKLKGPEGAWLLAANNHPWLFSGAEGLDGALRHLLMSPRRLPRTGGGGSSAISAPVAEPSVAPPMADLSSLGTVFLGKWNPSWCVCVCVRVCVRERERRRAPPTALHSRALALC